MSFGFLFGQNKWFCACLCFPAGQAKKRWKFTETWKAHTTKPDQAVLLITGVDWHWTQVWLSNVAASSKPNDTHRANHSLSQLLGGWIWTWRCETLELLGTTVWRLRMRTVELLAEELRVGEKTQLTIKMDTDERCLKINNQTVKQSQVPWAKDRKRARKGPRVWKENSNFLWRQQRL